MKRTLKINAVDFWDGFELKNHFYFRLLAEKYDLEISDTPDILLCGQFGENYKEWNECKKLVQLTESLERFPIKLDDYDYVSGYQLMQGDKFFYDNPYMPRMDVVYMSQLEDRSVFLNKEMHNRRFCNFLYYNESSGTGAKLRKDFCLKLSEYKRVDCPGRVLNNMDNTCGERMASNWMADKLEFLKQYKFTIAFENSRQDGYTTEKLWQPFLAGSIPIYWGNAVIDRDVNGESFINCNDYDNDFEAVIRRVIEVDNDEELYLYMLSKSPIKNRESFYRKDRLLEFLERVIGDSCKE